MYIIKLLIIGDVVGRPGRNILNKELRSLRDKYEVDGVIANCENASGGKGLTEKNANELFDSGIDVITMGNHVWDKKEIYDYIDNYPNIIRPANYPDPCEGKGYNIIRINDYLIGVINISGTVYLDSLECPFKTFDKIHQILSKSCDIILLDFHAEATSEKIAMGYYADGKASLVYGTHTHVQTADKRILSNGTGYITDIGMTGPYDGILGVDRDQVIEHLITKRPKRFDIAKGSVQINGLYVNINKKGICKEIINFINIYEN